MKPIDPKNASVAIGSYSQAVEINGLIITSGQLPVNPTDGTLLETISKQAKLRCKNVGELIRRSWKQMGSCLSFFLFLCI